MRVEVLLDSFGLAIEMMDVIFLPGDEPPPFLPFRELLGRVGFEQPDRGFDRLGVLEASSAAPARAVRGFRRARRTPFRARSASS